MKTEDRDALQRAKEILENPGLAVRLENLVGSPIEMGLKRLPDGIQKELVPLSQWALERSLRVALQTMGRRRDWHSSLWTNHVAVMAIGAGGGFFGMAGLAAELPVSTTIMLRGIAAIARKNREDTNSDDTRAACLEVFALGGPSPSDDAAESGYFAVRSALAKALGHGGAAKLMAAVATRFGVRVTEKAAAQAIPFLGAAGGAAINGVFMAHFQAMAEGHFTIRRLERKYCAETVRASYDSP